MKYCRECGNEINEKAVICPNCGCKVSKGFSTDKNKWVALALWFFLGAFGGHRFYVNDTGGAVGFIICTCLGWILLGVPYIFMLIFLIIDLVNILKGNLKGVELEG